MADLAQLEAAFIKADTAGNTEDAQAFATEIKRMRATPQPTAGRPTPVNAGLANFGASVVGLPVDTVQNVMNLGKAAAGTAATAFGRSDLAPDLTHGSVGGSEYLKDLLRKTGLAGLSPDNPAPGSKAGTLAYDLTSRGGMIPGAALPAIGSVIGEKLGGTPGAIIGSMAPAAAAMAASKIPRPTMTPQKQLLAGEGVSMTPGQMMGGTTQRLEDAATSIPVLGDAIKGAQRRGIESFDTAAINRSLAPIGAQLPKGAKGNGAVEYARMKLGDAYENLLPNLKGDLDATPGAGSLPAQVGQPAPPSFRQNLDSIKQMGAQLPDAQRTQLNAIIDKEVIGQFSPQGLASGETLKSIESLLGNMAKKKAISDNYHENQLGLAIKEIQSSMRNMVNEVNPNYAGELAKINEGYANFKKVQAAASNIGANEGVFTPAQLQRAVRAGDKTKDKRAFAEGDALMQDLSSAGKSVLSQTVPDSGTVSRAALTYALRHPVMAGALSLPVGAAAAAYSPMVQSSLQGILSGAAKPAPPQSQLMMLLQQGLLANQK